MRAGCPSWCVEDHSGYDELAQELGDIIRHESANVLGSVKGTVEFTDGVVAPLSAHRVLYQRPDGSVVEDGDGFTVGERFMPRDVAMEFFEHLHKGLSNA